MFRSAIKVLVIGVVLFAVSGQGYARDATDPLKAVVNAQAGLNKIEKRRLSRAIQNNFQDVPGFKARTFSSVQAIINAGLFELSVNTGDEDGPISELDMARICNVAKATYKAIKNGAEPSLTEDIALVGFAHEISSGQIEAASKALEELMQSSIAVSTYQELVSQALDNLWAPNVTTKTAAGLIRGARDGLDAEMLTLTLIIGVAQDLEDKGIDKVVEEADVYVRTRKDAAYEALKLAMRAGLAPPIGRELYYIAMEERWAPEISSAVFQGLVDGQKMGLTPEKLATALIVRVAQGLDDTPPPVAVREEIEFVKKLDKSEQQRVEKIQNDPDLKKAYMSANHWSEITYVPPKADEIQPQAEPSREPATPEAATPAKGKKPEPSSEPATTGAAASAEEKATPVTDTPMQPKPHPEQTAPTEVTPTPAAETPAEKKTAPEPAPAEDTQKVKGKKEETPATPAPAPKVEEKEEVAPTSPPPAGENKKEPSSKKEAPAVPDDEDLVAKLASVHRSLVQASINEYLGTPYKWGGIAKKTGTDCSGFTQGVYRDQGIKIPRVSRDQFKGVPLKLKSREDLVWGDLVFFNKNGGPDTYITHVGMFLGKDPKNPKIERFVHSCCSKGVTVSRFNKRYYLSRYVGGVRVGSVSDTEG